MKRKDWLVLTEVLSLPVCCCPHYRLLSKRFNLSEDALGSIFSQENQRRIVQSNSRLQEQIHFLAERYFERNDFLGLCCTHNWPPCFLIRRLLQVAPWNFGRQKITKILRQPELVLDAEAPEGATSEQWQRQKAQMLLDIKAALLCDPSNSPEADMARRDMGLQFETKLAGQLSKLGLAFWTEETLRAKGFFKTPDAKLQVPFLFRGQVIFWLDSKATFGGEYIHHIQQGRIHSMYGELPPPALVKSEDCCRQQVLEQYQKYVNRYGSGMVIYWFGVVDELVMADENIVLVSEMPCSSEIVKLPCLDMPRCINEAPNS